MKEFFKKLWEKIKAFSLKLKAWWQKTAKPWLKKSWMQIVNMIVLGAAYSRFESLENQPVLEVLTGIWLFLLLAYYIFWKLLGAEKMFKKEETKIEAGVAPVPVDESKVESLGPVEEVKVAPKKRAPKTKKK